MAANPSIANCTADTFTENCSGLAQLAASLQAVRSAQLPKALIRWESSAMGINTAGLIRPFTGCSQRISDSKPTTMLSAIRTIG